MPSQLNRKTRFFFKSQENYLINCLITGPLWSSPDIEKLQVGRGGDQVGNSQEILKSQQTKIALTRV